MKPLQRYLGWKKNEKMGWKAEGNECSANKANYVGMTTMYSENAKKSLTFFILYECVI